MPRKVVFTEEEKDSDIKDTLELLRDNPNCTAIASFLGRSVQYICNIKNYLDEEGILTKEEIEKKQDEEENKKNSEFDKNVLRLIQDGNSKSQIQIKLHCSCEKLEKSYERLSKIVDLSKYLTKEEQLEQERLNKIKNFVNDGTGVKYYNQIAKATDIPFSAVKKLVPILISNGSIESSSVINKSEERKEKTRTRNEEIYNLYDNKVPVLEIASQYGITIKYLENILGKRNQENKRKPKIPKKNYNCKEIDDTLSLKEKNILKYLKEGLSYTYISNKEVIEEKELMELVSSLKDRNYITQTIINEAREERRKYYLNMIKDSLNKGESNLEIYWRINKDVEELSMSGISKYIQKLIDDGQITKEEIEKKRYENGLALIDKKTLPLIKKGYNNKEIFETDKETFISEWYVKESRKRVIASENITKEQLKKWQEQRKLEKQNEIYEQDEIIIWNYVKEYGYDDIDIAHLIDACRSYVGNRRRAYQDKNGISKEEYLNIKNQGKIKRQKREKKQRKLSDSFKKVKELFQKEYEQSLPTLSTEQKYFHIFIELSEIGIYSFDKEEVGILSYIIMYEEEFLTDENIKYAMKKYLSLGEEDEAIRLLNSYINCDNNVKKGENIREMQAILQKHLSKKM